MSTNILNSLPQLQKSSGKQLNPVVVALIQDHSKPRALVNSEMGSSGKITLKPIKGSASLSMNNNRQSVRKVKEFKIGSEQILSKLNRELQGGESYPILTTVLGIAAGAATAGTGLLFTLATTGLTLANTTSKVLGRPGDEIWHVEEIGKRGDKAVYVSSFLIVDPYRKQAPSKGWLIHEERHELNLG